MELDKPHLMRFTIARMLEAGLINDDPETVDVALQRAIEMDGEKVVEPLILNTVNKLINNGFQWGPQLSSIYPVEDSD